jgi:hypothetical protein
VKGKARPMVRGDVADAMVLLLRQSRRARERLAVRLVAEGEREGSATETTSRVAMALLEVLGALDPSSEPEARCRRR